MKNKYKFYRKIFDIEWQNLYVYDDFVKNVSEKYNINFYILKSIIVIEKINRWNLYNRFVEILLAYLIPKVIVVADFSIGLCQIKPSTAKKVYKTINNDNIIKLLINPYTNIHICAKIIHEMKAENLEEIVLLYLTGTKNKKYLDDISIKYYINLCKHGITKQDCI
jgi:hypothetical protein